MKKISHVSSVVAVLSAISHIFCCGLPLLAALTGLGAVTGAFALQTQYTRFFHKNELWIMGAAAFMLLLGGVAQYVTWKLDCRHTGCVHEPCAPRKSLSLKVYLASCGVFILTLVIFFLIPHWHG